MSKKNQKQISLFESLSEDQKDFFLLSLEKKVRNINKKLKEINQLEIDRKEGKELNDAQLKKIASKDEHNSKIKEQEQIAKLYLEAKTEAEVPAPQENNTSELIEQAAIQISNLYYASLFSHQVGASNELSLAYQNIFNSTEVERITSAASQLTAYASGQLQDLQAQVNQVITSEQFLQHHQHVAQVEETIIVIAPTQNQEVVVIVEQNQNQEQNVEQQEQNTQQEQQTEEETQGQQQDEQIAEPINEVQETVIQVVEEIQNVQEVQQQGGEQQQEAPAQEEQQQKTFQKRTNSGGNHNRGQRGQRPREGEQNHQQQNENNYEGQQRRGPRNNNNRRPKNEGNNNNQNEVEVNEGWNVVRKTTGPQEGNFKQNRPFNKEPREHRENREGVKRQFHQGEKRPNFSGNGNRKPFNNSSNRGDQPQQQYVRKDQATQNPSTQTQQPQSIETN